jgi:hypothetical protein
MIGGNSFNISDATYGSLLVALNDMNYFIKLNYTPAIGAKKETYFFVFNLSKNNNIVNSFGLPDKLVTNGNLNSRKSKTWLELDTEDKKFIKIINGFAYKVEPEMKDNNFDASLGIPSKLTIGMLGNAEEKNQEPGYKLELGVKEDEHFMGNSTKLGRPTFLEQTNIMADMTNLINKKKEFDAGNKSLIDKTSLGTLENDFFEKLTRDQAEVLTDEDVEKIMMFISNEKNFLTKSEENPNLNKAILSVAAVYRKRFPNERKDIRDTQKEINDLKKLEKEEQKQANNIGVNPKKQDERTTNIGSTKLSIFDKERLEASILKNLPRSLPELTKQKIKEAINKLNEDLASNPEQMDINSKVLTPLGKMYVNGIKSGIIDKIISSQDNLINNDILLDIVSFKRTEGGMIGGADFIPNATTILTPALDEPNKISEYGEPMIYITPPKDPTKRSRILQFSEMGTDTEKIPVFGYLTVGKQMLLKLLDLQTNLNAPFTEPQTKYEKIKNGFFEFVKANPILALTVVGGIANAIGVAMAQSGLYGIKDIPTIKEVIISVFESIFGKGLKSSALWLTLSTYMSDPDRTKSWFKKPDQPPAGGGKKKSRKNIKTKRTKKRASRKVRRSRKGL